MEIGPPEDVHLAVKRDFENLEDVKARGAFEVLDAVNRTQSQLLPSHFRSTLLILHISRHAGTHGDGPNSGRIKRDAEDQDLGYQTGSWPQAPRNPAPNRDHDRTNFPSSSNSWRDRDERGGRERDYRERRTDSERDPESASGDRKRSLEYPGGRRREDHENDGRRECKCIVLFWFLTPSFLSLVSLSISLPFFVPTFFFHPPSLVGRGHRTLRLPSSYHAAPVR